MPIVGYRRDHDHSNESFDAMYCSSSFGLTAQPVTRLPSFGMGRSVWPDSIRCTGVPDEAVGGNSRHGAQAILAAAIRMIDLTLA